MAKSAELARDRDPAHHPRRGRRHGRRLGRLPARPGPAGVPRRRALLRRLPGQPRLHAPTSCAPPRTPGAEVLVLCDTNGGSLPHDVERSSPAVRGRLRVPARRATSTTTPAVRWPTRWPRCAGATQVQGCVNGYGERTGNADLTAAIPDLTLKMGVRPSSATAWSGSRRSSHHIAELVNIAPDPHQPFVGASAFAHKAGLHTSAIARRRDAYEHVTPDAVGNGTRFVVSRDGRPVDARAEGRAARPRARRRRAGDVVETLKDARAPRATTSRWPTGRSSC